MIEKTVAIILVLFLISCDSGSREVVEYYPDGGVKSVKEMKDGKLNGLHKIYYENGELKFQVSYQDSIMNGSFISYYEDGTLEAEYLYKDGQRNGRYKKYYQSGRLKETGTYENDLLRGTVLNYYDVGDQKLESKEILAQFGDKTVLVAYKYFNSLGNVTKELPLPYEVNFPEGVLKKGKMYNIEITLTRKKYDSIRLILGDFTTNFKLKNFETDTIDPEGNNFKFTFRPQESGKNVFRGLIEDFRVVEEPGHKTELINNKLVEIEYEVD